MARRIAFVPTSIAAMVGIGLTRLKTSAMTEGSSCGRGMLAQRYHTLLAKINRGQAWRSIVPFRQQTPDPFPRPGSHLRDTRAARLVSEVIPGHPDIRVRSDRASSA